MDNERHGIRASGEYAVYDGIVYFAGDLRDRVHLLSDDDPLPPGFEASPRDWIRGETTVPKASVQRLFQVRTTCVWRDHRFSVDIIVGDTANVTYLGTDFDEVCFLPGLHRPDKFEVIGRVPVSELTEVETCEDVPCSAADIFRRPAVENAGGRGAVSRPRPRAGSIRSRCAQSPL